MKPLEIILVNVPLILFLCFAGLCIHWDKNGLAIASFVMACLSATTFKSKEIKQDRKQDDAKC